MECNRDEAKRAKEIAENKISTKDMHGAKKFALKAQNLYPDLDGISQLLATLDIYIAAENKINNESDFYGILGVNSSADDDTVRKNYRKLALFLHPDKNKSIGADGAFKHISEAWSCLSDKTKRSQYDQRRNVKNGGTTGAPPPGQNGFYNFTKSTSSKAKGTTSTTTSTGEKQKIHNTFWTVCHGCKMQYEYLRVYLHQNLLCPNCNEPFLAMETAAPNTKVSTKGFKSQKVKRQKSTSQTTGFQWGQGSSAQAATVVQRTYEKVKREREEAQAAMKREEALKRKKQLKKGYNLSSCRNGNSVKRKPGEIDWMRVDPSVNIRGQLIYKARNEIRKKLNELRSKDLVNPKKENEKEKDLSNDDLKKNDTEPFVIDVTDSDFYNFNREKREMCFKEGQIWAAYDDDDGMPRQHAMIHKVNSVDPFKIKVCWLNSVTEITENEPDLFSGFPKPFGEFKTGKHETIFVTDLFSHKVNFTKLEDGILHIYPRVGEVWALYRNWSPEWNDETPNEIKHKYEIVQIDEFDEETGFKVTQLVKVAGFKTVFHRWINPKEARVIPENEIFRFSHQIPFRLLTGQESTNAPKGCHELDPAATPDEFLQVVAVEQDLENMDDVLVNDCGLTEPAVSAADVKEVVSI